MDGVVYHVENLANARTMTFDDEGAYAAFEEIVEQAIECTEMRRLSSCVMPNHWHLVARPQEAGDLSRVMGWLTLAHTQRLHVHRASAGHCRSRSLRITSSPRCRALSVCIALRGTECPEYEPCQACRASAVEQSVALACGQPVERIELDTLLAGRRRRRVQAFLGARSRVSAGKTVGAR